MGLFSKLGRDPPPTTTDYVEKQNGGRLSDTEKGVEGAQVEDTAQPHRHHVHPDAERAVVRKLDWRVPPLVMSLCMASLPRSIRLVLNSSFYRPYLVP